MRKAHKLGDIKRVKSKTDVDFFNKTTEKDILGQSISDPDTPYLTEEDFKEFTTSEERKRNDEKQCGFN